MSLAEREGAEEGRRKERFFAARKIQEDIAAKELHYQRLITENIKLKNVLKLAKTDLEDWIYSKGEDINTLKIISLINELV